MSDWNIDEVIVIGTASILLSAAWSLVMGAAYGGRGSPPLLILAACGLAVLFLFVGLNYQNQDKVVTFFILMVPITLSFEAMVSILFDLKWREREATEGRQIYYGMTTVFISTVCAWAAWYIANTWASS